VAVPVALLILAPWTVRNYLVFGRLIPVKSNLAYELYQSQCLQPDGLLQTLTFQSHPNNRASREGREFTAFGEMAYLDRKREQFARAVRADPLDYLDRVACRFLGATVWYVPVNRPQEARHPWGLWLGRLTHPLPLLGLLVLAGTAGWQRLYPAQWMVLGIYVVYLLPYIGASYYDRYAAPLLGVKVLLVLWAADRLLSLWAGRRRAAAVPGPASPPLPSCLPPCPRPAGAK
jgi:hypothetical protein